LTRRCSGVWCGLALVPALGATPSRAPAQSVVSGFASASLVEYRVAAGSGVERFGGAVLGLGGAVRQGPRMTLGVVVQGGTLEARRVGDLERRIGEISVDARLSVARWFALTGGASVRAVANDVARQRWVLVRFGGEARPAFMGTPLRAVLRAGVIPVVAVNGLPAPALALHAAAGLEYNRGALTLAASYGLERFDFPPRGGIRRLEQVSALTVRAGMRL
jgi:hypothetical protein